MAKIRTKARALDLLGRQQIAGIPTALSELFKNAHDAYADNVEVDYIRKNNLLILRDDGLGMTRDEFEERWLTIGTDSKFVDEDSIEQPVTDLKKANRQIMGEKGVGRLSIAAIGPQVLVMTRATRHGQHSNMVAALVNWTLFSFPKLDLDDIDIPIREVPDGKNLSLEIFQEMKLELIEHVQSLKGKISNEKIKLVTSQVEGFSFAPEKWMDILNQLDEQLDLPRDNLRLDQKGHGTHFVISPVDEILGEEIEEVASNRATEKSSRLEKALLGFTNTMYSGAQPPIIARFRDHTLEGECIDRISESIFYTPSEFSAADHHFEGKFNELGQFEGDISVYGEKRSVVVSWPDAKNKHTLCGPFKINLAYIQGTQRDTSMPPLQWKKLYDKTNRYGGLYIYRDGIRILPYGDSDFDWLRIEQRRSKSASEYFFSYRRMFGCIELSKDNNATLVEKAGREGFIENKAYKQLKSILENFFVQVAADFFNEKGDLSDYFIETRSRQQEQHKALQKRAKLKSEKKKKLKKQLESFFAKLDNEAWDSQVHQFATKVDNLFTSYPNSELSIDDFVFEVEQFCRTSKNELSKKIDISKPSGIGVGKDLEDLWDQYQVEKRRIESYWEEVNDRALKQLVVFEDKYGDRTGLRRRFHDSLTAQNEFHKRQLNEAYKMANESISSLQKQVDNLIRENKQLAKEQLDKVEVDFNSTSFSGKTTDELYSFKKSLETRIETTASEILERLETLTEQLHTSQAGSEENMVSSNELTAALESENDHLKEQHERNMEMVLLGMALGVVNHEFNSNIGVIRRGLSEMQPFAKRSAKFNEILSNVRTGFDHLDGYLRTFTPLTKRLARRKTTITGSSIQDFVSTVFGERVEKEDITLRFSQEFINNSIYTFTSTIYPAFINIIDNAIHWLGKSSGERTITFDATETGFSISDSGPGIRTIDKENVFEFGFSRRVGGQGMGLYVTKETLEKDGFQIALEEYSPNSGATFTIEPKEEVGE